MKTKMFITNIILVVVLAFSNIGSVAAQGSASDLSNTIPGNGTYQARCVVDGVTASQDKDSSGDLHWYVELTINENVDGGTQNLPYQDIVTRTGQQPNHQPLAQTDNYWLNFAKLVLGKFGRPEFYVAPPDTLSPFDNSIRIEPNHYRVYLFDKFILSPDFINSLTDAYIQFYGPVAIPMAILLRNGLHPPLLGIFNSNPESLVYFMCNFQSKPAPPPQHELENTKNLFSGDSFPHPENLDACYQLTYDMDYHGGEVWFSGDNTGQGSWAIDDEVYFGVTHQDGSLTMNLFTSNTNDMPPVNVSDYFELGENQVQVKILSTTPPNCGGGQLWLTWDGGMSPPSTEYYPIIQNYSIPQPIVGTQYRYAFAVPDWMHSITATQRMGSHANISFVGPDGTIYKQGDPNVIYIDTPSYSTISLNNVSGGHWEYVIDTTEASFESVFFFSIGGSQGVNPDVDSTPPLTTIQVDGTVRENSWFVSDVLVTLTAEDNPGGSGVAQIEYSLDGGESWILYDGAFSVTQEGVINLRARSIDHAGNIEVLPPTKILYIDKTSPDVDVWVDKITYTRVDLFTVHATANDPIPGSGVCSLDATFNSMPVENDQVIDLLLFHLGTYTVTATAVDCAGWENTNTASFELVATIESMQAALTRFCAEGYINHAGICNSLQKKLTAALAAQKRGNKTAAMNILEAFNAEVTAQTNKKIPFNIAVLLHEDANYVIKMIESTP